MPPHREVLWRRPAPEREQARKQRLLGVAVADAHHPHQLRASLAARPTRLPTTHTAPSTQAAGGRLSGAAPATHGGAKRRRTAVRLACSTTQRGAGPPLALDIVRRPEQARTRSAPSTNSTWRERFAHSWRQKGWASGGAMGCRRDTTGLADRRRTEAAPSARLAASRRLLRVARGLVVQPGAACGAQLGARAGRTLGSAPWRPGPALSMRARHDVHAPQRARSASAGTNSVEGRYFPKETAWCVAPVGSHALTSQARHVTLVDDRRPQPHVHARLFASIGVFACVFSALVAQRSALFGRLVHWVVVHLELVGVA